MFQLCRDLRDASFDRFRQPKILLNSLAQSLHPHNFTHCGAWPIYYFCGIRHLHHGCSIWPLIESQPVPFETQEELAYICTGASIWEAAEQAGMRSKFNQEVFVAFHGNQSMLCYNPPPVDNGMHTWKSCLVHSLQRKQACKMTWWVPHKHFMRTPGDGEPDLLLYTIWQKFM